MPNFETCYLHIGTGKTGSSSIQETLFSNRELLGELGYCYPGPVRNHYQIALGLSEDPRVIRRYFRRDFTPEEVREDARAHMRGIDAELDGSAAANVVFSSERFYVLKPELFDGLLNYMRGFARRVRVICYVRHPAARAVSGLQQKVKMGETTLDSFDPVRAVDRISGRLERIAAAAGGDDLILRPFERAQLHDGDVVHDFLRVIGVDDESRARFEIRRTNESLSQEAILLSDALNARQPLLVEGARNRARALAPNRAFREIRGAPFTLPPAQAEALLAAAEPECERLKARFGLSFAQPLFPEPGALWGAQTLGDIATVINDLLRENEALEGRIRRLRRKNRARSRKSRAGPGMRGILRRLRRPG